MALRHLTATEVLSVIAFRRGELSLLLDRRNLAKTGPSGVSGFTIAQGLQCVDLSYLPAVSVTFILNFTPVIVLVLGALVLGESPRPLQPAGMGSVLMGAHLHFNRPLSSFNVVGVLITLVSGLGWETYHPHVKNAPINESHQ